MAVEAYKLDVGVSRRLVGRTGQNRGSRAGCGM